MNVYYHPLHSTRVECIDAGAAAEDAFRLLSDRRIKELPVVSGGRVVGSLSRRNIMAAPEAVERHVL